MAADRPTFDESWHRVADLRLRLRSTVQAYRQQFRGRLWYVLHDLASNQFFRLDEAAYHFVGLLDGQRRVAQAWEACQGQLGDRAPTQGEAIRLLGQLYTSNLLQAELPPDAEGMFQRQRQRVRREVGGYVMNLLFARVPLVDPDRLLDRWTPVVGWIFTPTGLALWAVLMLAGLVSLAGRGEEWLHQARDVLAADNLPWLYASLVLIKALHELGHGVACKRMGRQERVSGEVHTLGVMLLALLPVPYVDASSAWAFRSKWRRAVVGVAGMYVELAAAAVAAVIWSRTAQGTAVHIIAHNAMLIASVSTVLFNANPLLRFDGYYILSDLLEIPNLSQRSQEYLSYLARRYALGVRRAVNPAQGRSERFWLAFYGVASSFYRVVVALGVALFVLERFFFIGALLLIGSVVGWVVLPMGKMVRYLLTDAELTRVRGRALAVSGGAAACVVVLTGVVPMPQRGTAQGVVEPRQWAGVFMGADGFVQQVLPSGQQVSPGGAVLVEARSATLTAHLEELRARRDAAEAQFRQTRLVNVAAAMALAQQIEALDGQIQRAKEEQAALRVEPPLAGVWLAPDLEQRVGAYVRRGEPLGVVATLEELVVRVAADQYLGPRLAMEAGEGQAVRMRIDGQPRWTYTGAIERILPAGQRRLPSPALGRPSGGAVAVSPEAEAGDVTAEPFFEVRIRPDDPPAGAPPLLAGQRVVVRFELPPRPLLAQVWQSLRQLMQRRLHI